MPTFTPSDIKWNDCIDSIASSATIKVTSTCRSREIRYLAISSIYIFTVRPCIEYFSHKWSGASAIYS